MIRYQLFTALTLLGCVVPWVTPRHFPVHRLFGTRAPLVMAWVEPLRERRSADLLRETGGLSQGAHDELRPWQQTGLAAEK